MKLHIERRHRCIEVADLDEPLEVDEEAWKALCGKHGAENISGCVTCPHTHPFSYGDDDNGAHTTLAEVVS